MEKRRRMTGQERRERILEAALQLFSERGFAGATTRELAARAGITEPVIYLHFRGKGDLFRAVLERYSFLPYLRGFAELPPAPLREQLLALGHQWRGFLRERGPTVALTLSEMGREPELARSFQETIGEGVALVIRTLQAQHEGEIRVDRLPAAVHLFFSSRLWQFVMLERMGTVADPQADCRLEAAVDLLVSAVSL